MNQTLRSLIAPMLAFDPSSRPNAAISLEQVRELLPEGSARASSESAVPSRQKATARGNENARERPAVRPSINREVQPAKGKANVGAKIVVVDRLGLDWTGIIVGLDEKRPDHILVRHESTRGNDNVRSYPLNQVVRGKPIA
jgi:hypothetical protein